MKITLAQLNFTVGDFAGNSKKIIETIKSNKNSDLIVFPELAVSGYPPEDLVLRDEFVEHSLKFTKKIITATKKTNCDALISTPWEEEGKLYNASLIISKGKIIHKQYKYDLPNYGVFDEKRVFNSGSAPLPFKYRDKLIGMLICEDTWNNKVSKRMEGAEFIISVNASPFERTKHESRIKMLKKSAHSAKCPILYLNQVSGHDDLVFDGGSMIIAKNGKFLEHFNHFEEQVKTFDINKIIKSKPTKLPKIDEQEHMYRAMMFGLKEYVEKNNFPGVLIGLSGGVDSALTASIAVDALGKKKVKLFLLPSKFTSEESKKDAIKTAENLGVKLQNINIEPAVEALNSSLATTFKGQKKGLAEENIQARVRGVLLMAISNKFNDLLLATGNKSEVAVGYSTLYGDMCGGYNPIKDLYKTGVFKICKWRNKNIPSDSKCRKKNVIVRNIINKAPTAELRDDQKDEDSLPKYEVLDKILKLLIEGEKSAEKVVEKTGYSLKLVHEIERLIFNSEYKRKQSAPGVKLSGKPFGRDRRYPITNKFLDY